MLAEVMGREGILEFPEVLARPKISHRLIPRKTNLVPLHGNVRLFASLVQEQNGCRPVRQRLVIDLTATIIEDLVTLDPALVLVHSDKLGRC